MFILIHATAFARSFSTLFIKQVYLNIACMDEDIRYASLPHDFYDLHQSYATAVCVYLIAYQCLMVT